MATATLVDFEGHLQLPAVSELSLVSPDSRFSTTSALSNGGGARTDLSIPVSVAGAGNPTQLLESVTYPLNTGTANAVVTTRTVMGVPLVNAQIGLVPAIPAGPSGVSTVLIPSLPAGLNPVYIKLALVAGVLMPTSRPVVANTGTGGFTVTGPVDASAAGAVYEYWVYYA